MALSTNQKVGSGISAAVLAIIAAVLTTEGGYVNNPKDPGGETNHGITKQVALDHGYTAPMIEMPKEVAIDIYRQDYIVKPGFEPFVALSPAVAEKLVDAGVNTGPSRPGRWLQTSLNALNRGGKDYPPIQVDGKVGAGTVAAYQGLVKVRGKVVACELILKTIDAQQATYYMSLTNMPTFTPGWVINRIGNVPLSRCKE